ncbi:class I SAM-dependent methyltransferase [Tamlana sp. 2201CG12-4]|uniref:class I SAM-dependent methyltransferase n=1 Tax=Tamlana sp. 2201CG12-4 TaxID=3112582 RepID=UPI002DBD0666|nr:class I SAM-dependent methyltransferase [Tamlana sp. 2201CG12-4]MEC3907050.1 class I SAM-dependent methyltransferase [Tamlana sp. 2201CG12-4]
MNEEIRNKFGIEENKPNDWFETLYSGVTESGDGIPWANMAPHPVFKHWIDQNPIFENEKTALVIGCGLGDDAIELESKGLKVTAFDVSHSAIELCKKRFPNSEVEFIQADLIKGHNDWYKTFDFVLEIFTIQALPPKYEKTLIKNISDFVSDNGKLVVITEIQKEKRTYENGPPWLLNTDYIKSFENCGLKQIFHSSKGETELGDEIHLTIFQR